MVDSINDQNAQKKQKGITGIHRLPLKDTYEIPQAILELGQGDPVSPVMVLDHLKRSPGTGTSGTLLGAAKAYGLTQNAGKKLQVTELGKTILNEDLSTSKRRNAEYEVLFSDEMFSAIVAKYTDKTLPPVDDIAHDFLKQAYKLTDSDAKIFWKVTKKNLSDFGLLKELSTGKKIVISREQAISNLGDTTEVLEEVVDANEPEQLPPEESTPKISKVNPSSIPNIAIPSPEFHFNIQIHLPADATSQQYDAIFKSIAVNLLGRKDDE